MRSMGEMAIPVFGRSPRGCRESVTVLRAQCGARTWQGPRRCRRTIRSRPPAPPVNSLDVRVEARQEKGGDERQPC